VCVKGAAGTAYVLFIYCWVLSVVSTTHACACTDCATCLYALVKIFSLPPSEGTAELMFIHCCPLIFDTAKCITPIGLM
jgi:hypothetical protein